VGIGEAARAAGFENVPITNRHRPYLAPARALWRSHEPVGVERPEVNARHLAAKDKLGHGLCASEKI